MSNYQNLEVWKQSMNLVEQVYKLIERLPSEERYALTDQIRRSAISIPSNIAEGSGRQTQKEFTQFLYIALGSASELETQLLICTRLNYFPYDESTLTLLANIKKMLNGLINSIKRAH